MSPTTAGSYQGGISNFATGTPGTQTFGSYLGNVPSGGGAGLMSLAFKPFAAALISLSGDLALRPPSRPMRSSRAATPTATPRPTRSPLWSRNCLTSKLFLAMRGVPWLRGAGATARPPWCGRTRGGSVFRGLRRRRTGPRRVALEQRHDPVDHHLDVGLRLVAAAGLRDHPGLRHRVVH